MKKLSLSLATLALAATAAQAQDTGAPPADQDAALPNQPSTTAPPAADAGVDATAPAPAPVPQAGVSAGAVSDAEVQSYAQATVKVQEIAKNSTLDDQAKQQQMASAVSEAGLDPARFNEITKALGSDTALRTRIQTALAAHAAAHQG